MKRSHHNELDRDVESGETNTGEDMKRQRFDDENVASVAGVSEGSEVDGKGLEVRVSEAVGKSGLKARRDCPYLSSVNRYCLDFDFQAICKVSGSKEHVYCCLVCGEFLQGRGWNTPAMTHALSNEHCLYISLRDGRVFCIPDNYEVLDASLEDIKFNLAPTYSPEDVAGFRTKEVYGKALNGADYIVGIMGLNSINQSTDYANVVIQLLCAAIPLREQLLLYSGSGKDAEDGKDSSAVRDPLVYNFQKLVKKLFNPKSFKGIASPHEFLQACHLASQKKFTLLKRSDAHQFLIWLINYMDRKTKKSGGCKWCQGKVRIETIRGENVAIKPFFCLSLNVPESPLFTSPTDTIPEAHLFELLDEYGGNLTGGTTRKSIEELPEYLILHIKRFSRNNFFTEKNPTLIRFPTRDLDLSDYVEPDALPKNPNTRYDLVCNIAHMGSAEGGYYVIYVYNAPSDQWYEVENLRIVPTEPHRVAGAPAYIQMWKRQVPNDKIQPR